MKKVCLVIFLVSLVALLSAQIGWSGNIWPNSGSHLVNGNDINVYYQIYKAGVTDSEGQGANITATLYYRKSTGAYQSVSMTYHGDVGSNDEYTGTIPNTYFVANDDIEFYCEGYDVLDDSYSYGTDQNNAGPFDSASPGTYYIDAGLNQSVAVTFSVNMGLLDPGWYSGGVSVQGNVLPLDWTPGSNLLTDPDEDQIYTGIITFSAGSAPSAEYKFTRDDGSKAWNWESVANRPFTIDDSGPTQTLAINFWDDDEPVAVNLSSFYALYIGERPSIYWVTQSEEDNEYWNIYRGSSDNFIEALHLNASNPIPGNGTTNSASDYVYVDTTPVVQNTTYWYWIEDVAIDGESEVHEPISLSIPGETPNTPVKYGLHQNYPNPFNPSTSISFTLEEDSDVEILIFNVKGEQIKKYDIPSHQNSVVWDGTDHIGNPVSSGVYFYKLITDTKEYQKKMMLVK